MSTDIVSGLFLLWLGAVALGALVMLRDRWRMAATSGAPVPSPQARKGIEAVCLFAGTGGLILGLGFLGLGLGLAH